MSNELHVVLGATGGAGRAITEALVATGHTTRTVSRSGRPGSTSAESVAADIEADAGAASAVAGASVVYMAAQPPYDQWPGRFPAMLRRVVDACGASGAKLVMVDNLYGYGPVEGPMFEHTPEAATDRKGRVRREMTSMLLDAHRSGLVRVVIGRASDYFGSGGDGSTVDALAVNPAAAGKRPRWVGRTDVPHSLAFLPDIGRAYVTLGTSDRADGEIWHLPHQPPITGEAFMQMLADEAGAPLEGSRLSKAMLVLAAGFHRPSRELVGILHQWTAPYVVDDTSFRAVFGPFDDTPPREAVRAALVRRRERGVRTVAR